VKSIKPAAASMVVDESERIEYSPELNMVTARSRAPEIAPVVWLV
jgi:hypothetical protein